ncbi:MAG: radical SAM protein [Methanobacteriota archaeon]
MTAENKQNAFSIKFERSPDLLACYPHPSFPTISITGDACALCCKHCGRHYLKNMISCTTPETLHEECLKLSSNGVKGVLLSGGYNSEGYVPFEPFLDAIEQVKRKTGLFISTHTGLVPEWLAREMGRAGIDLADFDLIGDNDTIELVLGLDRTVEDYRQSMKALKRSIPYVVPHICVGLHAGELRGEFRALGMASEIEPELLVLLVLTPTLGTEFERLTSPSEEDFKRVAVEARFRFPNTQLALGCMRPRDSKRFEIELASLQAGFDRIELPSDRTVKAALGMGFNVRKLHACCAVPEDIINKLKL